MTCDVCHVFSHAPLLFEEDVERVFIEKFSAVAGQVKPLLVLILFIDTFDEGLQFCLVQITPLQARLLANAGDAVETLDELWLLKEGSAIISSTSSSSSVVFAGEVVNETSFLLQSTSSSPVTIAPGPSGCSLWSITRSHLHHEEFVGTSGSSWCDHCAVPNIPKPTPYQNRKLRSSSTPTRCLLGCTGICALSWSSGCSQQTSALQVSSSLTAPRLKLSIVFIQYRKPLISIQLSSITRFLFSCPDAIARAAQPVQGGCKRLICGQSAAQSPTDWCDESSNERGWQQQQRLSSIIS